MMWLVGSALAWEHLGLVHQDPLLLEITTADAQGVPEGAVQQAVRQAVDLWTEDACLETLAVTVTDSELNVLGFGDGHSLVSVDTETGGYPAVTYSVGSETAFVRFGQRYDAFLEVDVTMGPAAWDLDDEVLAGTCDGEPLSYKAAEMLGFVLGMSRPDLQADSLYNMPYCSLPGLGPDDRAGMRALYGAGVSPDCEEIIWLDFGMVELPLDACVVETYGTSPVLALWVETEAGQQHPLDAIVSFDTPGLHTLQVCGEFEVPPGCDQPVVCAPWPQQALVCAEPTPAPEATLQDSSLHLVDRTELTDPNCIFERAWTVLDQDDQEVASAEGTDARVELPGPGLYEVVLTLYAGSYEFSASIPVEWEAEAAEEPPAQDKEGCGCDQGGGGPGWLLGLLLFRRFPNKRFV